MYSFRSFVATAVVALLAIAPAFGQAPARVRGTITAVDDRGLTVKERDGHTFRLFEGRTGSVSEIDVRGAPTIVQRLFSFSLATAALLYGRIARGTHAFR